MPSRLASSEQVLARASGTDEAAGAKKTVLKSMSVVAVWAVAAAVAAGI